MGKREFKDYICRPFCKFFREGEKEEMACRGARVVELLVQRGGLKPGNLPRHGKDPSLWDKRDTALEKNVCQNCPFYTGGCDFQSPNQPPGSEPCGGYILLSLLKEKGNISVADLEESAGE